LCLTMALIGFSSAILQGAVVRPLYKRLSDKQMALMGSVLEVIGFLMMAGAVYGQTLVGFFGALLIVVAGFAFIQPSVHSLLSRMAPEDRQGAVLGTGQSVNALARILGSALAIPLLKWNLFAPYIVAAGLLAIAGIFLQRSLRARG
jgi:fucose permease